LCGKHRYSGGEFYLPADRMTRSKEGNTPLIRVHPDLGAIRFCTQASQHRTAIQAAVAYVDAENMFRDGRGHVPVQERLPM
jgi:hypothetical protein